MESVEEWDTTVLRILRTERISRAAVEEEWESALRRAVLVPFTIGCGDVGFERMVEVDEPHMRDAIERHEELCRSRYLAQVHAAVRLHVLSGSPPSTGDPSAYFYYSDLASSGPNAMSLPDSFYHALLPPTSEDGQLLSGIVNRTVPPQDVSRGHRGAEQAGRADIADEEVSEWHTILDMQASVKVAQFAVGLGQLEEAWRGEVEMDEFEARHFYIIRPHCQLMVSRLQSSGPGGASFVSNVAIQTALGAYYRRNNLRVAYPSSPSMPSLYSKATSPALRQESILMHLLECFTASSPLGRPIGAPPTPFPHGSEPISRLLVTKMEAQARINVAAVYISCRLLWEEEWARMKVQLAHNFWKLGCLKPIFNEVIVKEQRAWEDLQYTMKPFLDNVREEVECIQARRARVEAKRKWFEALHEREREKRIEMGLNRDQFTLLMKAEQLQSILDVQDRYVSMAIVASEGGPPNRQITNGGAGRELALQWGQRDVDEDDLHVTDEDATRERREQEGVLPGITSRLLALTDIQGSNNNNGGGEVVSAKDAPSTIADRFHRDLQALTAPTTTMQDLRSYHQGLVAFESTLTRGEEDLLGEEWLEYQATRRRQPPQSPQQVANVLGTSTQHESGGAEASASRSPSYGSSLNGASPTWAQDEWGRPMHSSPSHRIHAAHTVHTTAAQEKEATFASPKPRLPWSEAPAGRSQSEVASRRDSVDAAPLQQPIPTPHYMTSLFGGRSSSRDYPLRSELDASPQMSWGVSRSGGGGGASPRTQASPLSHYQSHASPHSKGNGVGVVPSSRGTSAMSSSGVGVGRSTPAHHPAESSSLYASGPYPTSKWYEPSSPKPTRPATATTTAATPYSPPRQPLVATLDSRSVSVSTTGGERRPLMGVPLPVRSGSATSSVQSFPASLASYQYH